MSCVSHDRSIRWQDIQKGLQFIQSTLPFPGTQEQYEVFIQDLVRNLFREGNDVYSEGEWARSVELYAEALSITEYAASEDISVSAEIVEKLHANRAAAYLNIGLHDQALEDCETVLQLNADNHRALYRKARALRELGRHKEAYEAVAKCSLAVPQDVSVIKLTQELATMLGLKIRKAYVRSKPALNVLPSTSNAGASNDKFSLGCGSVEDIQLVAQHTQETLSVPGLAGHRSAAKDELSNESPPVSNTSSVSPIESRKPEAADGTGARARAGPSESYPVPESRLDYDSEIIGDDLDDLLDLPGSSESPVAIPSMKGPIPLTTGLPSSNPMPSTLLAPAHAHHSFAHMPAVNLPPPYHETGSPGYSSLGLDSFSSSLDSLDTLSISETQTGYRQHPYAQMRTNDNPLGPPAGLGHLMDVQFSNELGQMENPLAETHEFKQACSHCFVKTGPGLLEYTLYAEDHSCKKDLLVGRLRLPKNLAWKPIRPRPTKNQYVGPYYICKDVAAGEGCKYPGHCTFAYCQEEIDLWTLERKGFVSREMLFDPLGSSGAPGLSLAKILQEHHGIFTFLCGACFDNKPRIISKMNKNNPSLCSHPVSKHPFEEKKCLVHILRENTVRYSKIRPYNAQGQMDLCWHEVRYGCVREDDCFFAHSLVELKVWMLQHERGISHEDIVQESSKFGNLNTSFLAVQQAPSALKKFGPSHLKMRLVCGQCWRNGQVIEADKNKKYCSAKAMHPWSKERQVVLVSSMERKKWTPVRPFPTKKPIPSQFEICMHVSAGKKCLYIGNCSFAHSPEERDLWTSMKENDLSDLEQLYELWLQSQKPGLTEETSGSGMRENGRPIHMPTDYAEEVVGNHCWLCGKNCNSDKQWQQHITSEKHKDKVFNSEDDQNCWQYRFPTGTFRVCERYLKGTCTEGENCMLAHGNEELTEWKDRRKFLLMKLEKARKDHLIAPNDNDFGKYSFLLKDIS